MDRGITYAGQIPLDTDVMFGQAAAYEGLAWLAQGVFGTGPFVTDLTCTQTTVASLSVLVNPGQVLELETFDSAPYSDLGTNANQIVKQGLLRLPATIGCAAPTTAGFSVNYLIEAAFQTVDGGSTVLPYYNASNPSQAFSGPNGSGTSQNTRRFDQLVVQAKAGTPAATGTQTTPSPDAGFIGLFVVTVAQGQTQITSSSISQLATAPFVTKLPQVPTAVLNNQWVFGQTTGGPTAYALTLAPIPSGYQTGMEVLTQFNVQNSTTSPTLNINSLGAVTIIKSNGSTVQPGDLIGFLDLIYDGSNFRINGLVASDFQRVLPSNTTVYVDRSIGSDTLYDGSSATISGTHGPWKTVQYAVNQLSTFNLNGNSATIQLGATGTYSGLLSIAAPNSGTLVIRGNPASQSSYTISGAPASALASAVSVNSGSVQFVGVTLSNSGSTASTFTLSVSSANVLLSNVTVSCANSNALGLIQATPAGVVAISTGCIITSSAGTALYADNGGVINVGASLTVSGTPAFSGAFAYALVLGVITSLGTPGGISITGSASGPRYSATGNAVIYTNTSGASFFPGSTAGSTATGGQYI